MSDTFRITMVQANPVLGAIAANAEYAFAAWEAGRDAGIDLVALTEMFLTGYQTQDLVLKPAFVEAAEAALQALAARIGAGPALAIGCPLRRGDLSQWLGLFGAFQGWQTRGHRQDRLW